MTSKKFFKKEWTLKWYELDSIIIVTMLSIILLITIWTRFRNDAMSIQWYGYAILIILFSIPLWKKTFKK